MWDQRYGDAEFFYGTEPNEFLRGNASHLPRGSLLCIGDGEGRNGVWLAQQGHTVTSVDLSAVGLDKAQQLARQRGVHLTTQPADLATFDLGEERWHAVVSIFCHLPSALRRDVYRRIVRALRPGGVVLLESYTPAQLGRGTGGPPDVDMLVDLATLRADFAGLEVLVGRELEREVWEGKGHRGASSVVQFVARK
ncbi:MAG: class I SAM-dependent methyltransferase [Planctomycetes bacterium]|nr:class I SAM-dependent methyltransferase [Planctomycetota bacterium]